MNAAGLGAVETHDPLPQRDTASTAPNPEQLVLV